MSQDSAPAAPQTWQERLARIMETMRELSTQTDPQAMVHQYYERMRQVHPLVDRRMAISRRGLKYPQFRVTRFSEWAEDINPWKEPERLPLLSGGLLAELIYGNEPRIINDLVVAPDDPAFEYLSGMRSLQAIPLIEQGEALNMSFHFRRDTDGFSLEHLPEAVWLANLFGRATTSLVLAEQVKTAYEEIDRELKVVAHIQHSLLPRWLPSIPSLKLATHYQTARRAGGDYYDFFSLPDGEWGLFIADVSGHGTPAAVVMAVMHSIVHAYSGFPSPPSRMLSYLNDRLCEHYIEDSGRFVTAFFGIFNPETHELMFSSAGHNPPRWRSSEHNEVRSLDAAQCFPLGLMPSTEYVDATVQLHPGDLLVLYTDGIVEASNAEGELFGVHRLDALLSGSPSEPQEFVTLLRSAVQSHEAGTLPTDDQTAVVARVN